MRSRQPRLPFARQTLNLCLKLFLVSPLLLGSAWDANALATDKDQEILLEYDVLEGAVDKGVTIIRGNAKVKQGSINLSADRITLYRNEKGIERVVAQGEPAHYQQQIRADEALIHAYGKTIEYFVQEERFESSDEAKLEWGQDTVTGGFISYNVKDGTYQVNKSGSSSTINGGRGTLIIQPDTIKNGAGQKESGQNQP